MSKDWSTLSCEVKPGGGALLGTENPGGAEIWDLAATKFELEQINCVNCNDRNFKQNTVHEKRRPMKMLKGS